MATHHGGTECPLDRGIDLNAEDPEPTDIDNEIIHCLDFIVALRRQRQKVTLKMLYTAIMIN